MGNFYTGLEIALKRAAKGGHLDVVLRLLTAAKANCAYPVTAEALEGAVEGGHTEIVRILLRKGANVHKWAEDALAIAAEKNCCDIVRLILNAGAGAVPSHKMDWALEIASKGGQENTVKTLLDAGAFARNEEALLGAAKRGHTHVVRLLVIAGADVHIEDEKVLTRAAENGHYGTVKFLLWAGVNPYAEGCKAIERAGGAGYWHIARLLEGN
ncbi:hypothetical protein HDV00_010759 [Rhizophlyctis rosea]|nr:hypothetical protein HDV00_010759 [Rhizophlyctis rosea]